MPGQIWCPMTMTKAVFAAGGTGGHIFPAIAVADELRTMVRDIHIVFAGAKGKIEEQIVPKNGYMLKTFEISGFKRSISLKNIAVLSKFTKALKEAKEYLNEFRPGIVYGTGGYVSGPVLTASVRLGIPTVIQEGNFYPGLTVKWLARKVNRVLLNFEESKRFFGRQDNLEVMHYPVRARLKRYAKAEALRFFGLKESKKTLFAFGGSQGASSINKALLGSAEKIERSNMQLIWQTGASDFETIKEKIKGFENIKLFEFIDNIEYAYSAADLVVCRAGVSTLMELASFGAAVLFVPFALASDNHQEKNAKALVDAGAAEILLDQHVEAELFNHINRLLNDKNKLVKMGGNIRRFADSSAASRIAGLLIKISQEKKN